MQKNKQIERQIKIALKSKNKDSRVFTAAIVAITILIIGLFCISIVSTPEKYKYNIDHSKVNFINNNYKISLPTQGTEQKIQYPIEPIEKINKEKSKDIVQLLLQGSALVLFAIPIVISIKNKVVKK